MSPLQVSWSNFPALFSCLLFQLLGGLDVIVTCRAVDLADRMLAQHFCFRQARPASLAIYLDQPVQQLQRPLEVAVVPCRANLAPDRLNATGKQDKALRLLCRRQRTQGCRVAVKPPHGAYEICPDGEINTSVILTKMLFFSKFWR